MYGEHIIIVYRAYLILSSIRSKYSSYFVINFVFLSNVTTEWYSCVSRDAAVRMQATGTRIDDDEMVDPLRDENIKTRAG